MEDTRACAACLTTGVRMHSMTVCGLQSAYELLSGVQVSSGASPSLCWRCAALVRKFLAFRDSCRRAHALLKGNGTQVIGTQDIDREQAGLLCPYAVETAYKLSVDGQRSAGARERRPRRCKASRRAPRRVKREIKNEEMSPKTEPLLLDVEYLEDLPSDECHDGAQLDAAAADVNSEHADGSRLDVSTEEEDQPAMTGKRNKRKTKQTKPSRAHDIGAIEVTLTQEQRTELVSERRSDARYVRAPYKCELCIRPFTSDTSFRNHMMQHDPVSGDLACPVCELRYKTGRKLTAHMRLHTKKYVCKICAHVTYNRIMARVHYSWHKGIMFTCNICGAKFTTKRRHLVHVRAKHPPRLACADCGAAFVSERGLRYHAKLVHTVKAGAKRSEAPGPYCAACDVQFSSAAAWTRHVLISARHEREQATISNGCRQCGETFPSPPALLEHARARHARWRAHRQPGARRAWPQPRAEVTHCHFS